MINALTIAGSDPSGGAGIQADLKTFSALAAYGMAVITAVTAQSTIGVTAFERVSPTLVAAQIDTLFADVRVDTVKVGMLADAEVATAVADGLDRWKPPRVVLDPVMVATSGDRLLAPEAVDVIRRRLAPTAHLITPNVDEAAILAGSEPAASGDDLVATAIRLAEQLGTNVLVKGGHIGGEESIDVLGGPDASGGHRSFRAPRVATTNTHGTGCTLSSAIAALRPASSSWTEAVGAAKAYLTNALRAGDRLDVGHGAGPVHHFWASWDM